MKAPSPSGLDYHFDHETACEDAVFIFVLAGCGDSASGGLETNNALPNLGGRTGGATMLPTSKRLLRLRSAVATTTAAPTTTDVPTTTQAADPDEMHPTLPESQDIGQTPSDGHSSTFTTTNAWEYESFINSVAPKTQAELEDMVFSADWSVLDYGPNSSQSSTKSVPTDISLVCDPHRTLLTCSEPTSIKLQMLTRTWTSTSEEMTLLVRI